MTKPEFTILERLEEKIDKINTKFNEVMEKYIIPNDVFIKNCKQDKIDKKDKRTSSLAQKITVTIAIGNGLLAVFLAFFR